jgi:alcohol dehydrogenase class IV
MAPHAPRGDVIAATKAARQAEADQIFTFGGGDITDTAKVMALCLANDIHTLKLMGCAALCCRPGMAVPVSQYPLCMEIKSRTSTDHTRDGRDPSKTM